jgi:DNA-directed RNA polymerase subunit RPC12/RpoP
MKTKCYQCGYKNEKNSYKCEKCWENFRQSKEKYEEFLKNQKEEIKKYQSNEPETPDYKQAKRICRIPFIFGLLYAWKNVNLSIAGWKIALILVIWRWLILTLILLRLKKFIIRYAEKNNKSESFVATIMFILLLWVFLISYSVLLLF